METSRSPFCDGTDEGSICITTLGEPLVDANLVFSNFFLQRMQESCCQRTVGPTPWETNRRKKYVTIRPICKHIVHHRVTVISTVECILLDMFIGAFGGDGNSINESNYIWNNWRSCLNKGGQLPHLCLIGKLNHCNRMIAQLTNNQSKHCANCPTANSRRNTKNQAHMLVIHCATQIK